MPTKQNPSDEKDSFPFIPIIILVMFFVSAYFTFVRAYETKIIRYFMSEEEVENFDPMKLPYGN